MPSSRLELWGTSQLRLTAFFAPSATLEQPDAWWLQVTGEPPDKTIKDSKQATVDVQGGFADGLLTLKTQPTRIDWLYTPATPPDALPDPTAVIGPMPAGSAKFSEPIAKWFSLPDCPELIRLAFGAVLLIPAESRVSGYEALGSFLPSVKIDAKNSSDFQYQINRPRQSSVLSGLTVNRLSKWGVAGLQSFVASPAGLTFGNIQHFSRLELDINTSHENVKVFSKEAVPQLFKELVQLGAEIAEKGDVA
jgi:hypothetical protein